MGTPHRWLYRAFGTRTAAHVLLRGADTLGRLSGSNTEGWLSAFERRFVRSGWPGHRTNWINLHASGLLSRARRIQRGAPAPPVRRPATPRAPLRVGIVGRFVGLLGFPTSLFETCPSDLALTLFDVSHVGRRAEYLQRIGCEYRPVDLDGAGPGTRDAARAIQSADLDLLVNVNWKPDAHDLLDIVETGCIANYCVGSDLLHHPRVDIELVWQVQADNVISDGRLWCTQAHLPVGATFVHQISGLYDERGLSGERPRSWNEREPLIVSHGSLYKFAVPEFTQCMLEVLAQHPEARWVLMGKDDGAALDAIRTRAAARGMSDRVRYDGEFSAMRNAEGMVDDAGWVAVQDLLRRARLAPDPFPIGSGSARFEGYVLGAPSVHMGIRGRQSKPLATCDLPVLSVPIATAETLAEYQSLAIRCLSDASYASEVQTAQLAAARRACDPRRWWAELREAYDAWLDAMPGMNGVPGARASV